MVVNDGHEPGLDEAPASQVDEERALDVDVPEFVGATSLVAGSGSRRDAATSATFGAQEAVDVSVADPVDLAPTHLGGDPLRVPVCEEADSKDDRLDPSRDGGSHPMRASGIGNQTGDSICHEGGLPAVEGSRRAADLQTGVLDAGSGQRVAVHASVGAPQQSSDELARQPVCRSAWR
jgi:hypothetical protein